MYVYAAFNYSKSKVFVCPEYHHADVDCELRGARIIEAPPTRFTSDYVVPLSFLLLNISGVGFLLSRWRCANCEPTKSDNVLCTGV